MKQMSLIEMDGFLKGKCIPRDLKVNETNAEYLVRKFAEAEAKCAALAAENAGLKSSREVLSENALEACNAIASAGFRNEAIMRGLYASTGNRNKYPKPIATLVDEALREVKTPSTDAFLSEVRAQGVEMAMEHMQSSGSLTFGYCYISLNEFAAQLRKGGNQ